MSLFKQTTSSGISHTVSISSQLLLQVMIARIFGPGGRGIYASVFALSGFMVLYLGTGHGVSNAYLIASGKQSVNQAAMSSILGIFISVLLISIPASMILIFRPVFISMVENRILVCGFMAIPFNLSAIFFSGVLRGIGRSDLSYWYYGIVNSTWMICVAVLCGLLSIHTIGIVFISKMAAEVVALFVMLYFLRSYINSFWFAFRWKPFLESTAYSLKFYFTRVVNPMAIRLEILIIPVFLMDEAALGLYSQAFAILSQIMMVSNVVGYVLMPQIAKSAVESARFTAQACRLVLSLTLVLGILLMIVSKFIVPVIFGKDFSPVIPLMWIMFPGIIIQSIAKILYHYFQGINKPMTVSVIFFLSLVAMILIDVASIPRFGIKGAAFGTLIAFLLQTGMFTFAFAKRTKMRWHELFILNSTDWQYISNKFFGYFLKKR